MLKTLEVTANLMLTCLHASPGGIAMRIRLTSHILHRTWFMDVAEAFDASTQVIKGKVAAFLRTQYSRIPDLEMALLDKEGKVIKVVFKRDAKST